MNMPGHDGSGIFVYLCVTLMWSVYGMRDMTCLGISGSSRMSLRGRGGRSSIRRRSGRRIRRSGRGNIRIRMIWVG